MAAHAEANRRLRAPRAGLLFPALALVFAATAAAGALWLSAASRTGPLERAIHDLTTSGENCWLEADAAALAVSKVARSQSQLEGFIRERFEQLHDRAVAGSPGATARRAANERRARAATAPIARIGRSPATAVAAGGPDRPAGSAARSLHSRASADRRVVASDRHRRGRGRRPGAAAGVDRRAGSRNAGNRTGAGRRLESAYRTIGRRLRTAGHGLPPRRTATGRSPGRAIRRHSTGIWDSSGSWTQWRRPGIGWPRRRRPVAQSCGPSPRWRWHLGMVCLSAARRAVAAQGRASDHARRPDRTLVFASLRNRRGGRRRHGHRIATNGGQCSALARVAGAAGIRPGGAGVVAVTIQNPTWLSDMTSDPWQAIGQFWDR